MVQQINISIEFVNGMGSVMNEGDLEARVIDNKCKQMLKM
jgi:hypothetical protein